MFSKILGQRCTLSKTLLIEMQLFNSFSDAAKQLFKISEAEFEHVVMEWLRHSNTRLKREVS